MATPDFNVVVGGDDSLFQRMMERMKSSSKTTGKEVQNNLTVATTFKPLTSGLADMQRQFNSTTKETMAFQAIIRNAGEPGAKLEAANKSVTKSLKDMGDGIAYPINGLPRLRYALYDVSNASMAAAAAFAAIPIASATMAIKAERNFADVERTTGVAGIAAEELRAEFVKLAQSMPASWTELTDIGTLAGQLGIANDQVAKFTENVVQFSTTTNLSVEASATALARLSQLLPGVNDNWEGLGSAILKVGTNSAATETEIVAVAQQIAPIASLANMSAASIIGWSGALASVKVPPELSRGMMQRSFAEITSALESGSVKMEEYGKVMGISGAEFRKAWLNDSSTTFAMLLKGIAEQGGAAEATLVRLGISASRDAATMKKLGLAVDDVLLPALEDSRGAFGEGTEMQKQYAVIAETMAEKLKVLANNFEMFMVSAGAAATSMGGVIDVAVTLLQALTAFANTPFGKSFFTITAGASAFIAVGLVVVSVFAKIRAGVLAFFDVSTMLASRTKEVNAEMKMLNATSGAGAGGIKKVGVAAQGAALSMMTLKGALISTGIGLAVVAISSAIGALIEMSSAAQKTTDNAKQLADSGLADAMKNDYQAAVANGEAVKGYGDTLQEMGYIVDEDGQMISLNSEYRQKNADKIREQVAALNEYGMAVGKETRAKIAEGLVNDEDFKNLEKWNARMKEIGMEQYTIDINKVLNLSMEEGGVEKVKQYIAQVKAEVSRGSSEITAAAKAAGGGGNFGDYLFGGDVRGVTFIFDDLVGKASTLGDTIRQALGIAGSDTLSQWVEGSGEAADATEMWRVELQGVIDGIDEVRKQVQQGLSIPETIAEGASSFQTLIQGIIDGGTSFDYFSEAGQTNMSNLSAALVNTAALAQAMGATAADGIAIVFAQMQAKGVDTATLVSMLQQQVAAGAISMAQYSQILAGTFQFSSQGAALNKIFGNITQSVKGTEQAVGSTAKKVRTLIDYANDLAAVWKRAFDIRYGPQKELDKITKGFRSIAEAAADARTEIEDIRTSIAGLNADVQTLTADKALQEYFLSVANAYGDSLKAGEIRAQIAEIDAELVKKNTELAKANQNLGVAQAKTNKTLIGNSDAAVSNRAEIIGLVADYQSYIQSLAASGMSQEDLSTKARQLREDFIAQAMQVGYNHDELIGYAAAFDDVSLAISRVPRNITVRPDMDPAIQALNELRSKADTATAPRSLKVGMDQKSINDYMEQLNALSNASDAAVKKSTGKTEERTWYQRIWDAAKATLSRFGINFATGGYVTGPGTGTSDSIPANLSNGEYVINSSAVRKYGPGFFDQLNQMKTPQFFSGGAPAGGSGSIVSLSPEDRALLRNIGGSGNIVLYADSKELARSVNDGNRQIVASGGRP